MAKIVGGVTATPSPQPDWNQTDPMKAGYIKNKPDIDKLLSEFKGGVTSVNGQTGDVTIPAGEKGEKGDPGEQGIQGVQGEKGEDGYTPVKGVDYYTEDDKEELVAELQAEIPSDVLIDLQMPWISGSTLEITTNGIPVIDKPYRVDYWDTQYIRVCGLARGDGHGNVMPGRYIGNAHYFSEYEADTGEPFLFIFSETENKATIYITPYDGGDMYKFAVYDVSWGELPVVYANDNGKILQVKNGTWQAVAIPNAEGASF